MLTKEKLLHMLADHRHHIMQALEIERDIADMICDDGKPERRPYQERPADGPIPAVMAAPEKPAKPRKTKSPAAELPPAPEAKPAPAVPADEKPRAVEAPAAPAPELPVRTASEVVADAATEAQAPAGDEEIPGDTDAGKIAKLGSLMREVMRKSTDPTIGKTVKGLITRYGAANVSDLTPEQRNAVWNEVRAIERAQAGK